MFCHIVLGMFFLECSFQVLVTLQNNFAVNVLGTIELTFLQCSCITLWEWFWKVLFEQKIRYMAYNIYFPQPDRSTSILVSWRASSALCFIRNAFSHFMRSSVRSFSCTFLSSSSKSMSSERGYPSFVWSIPCHTLARSGAHACSLPELLSSLYTYDQFLVLCGSCPDHVQVEHLHHWLTWHHLYSDGVSWCIEETLDAFLASCRAAFLHCRAYSKRLFLASVIIDLKLIHINACEFTVIILVDTKL